jgi:hypothetical protein
MKRLLYCQECDSFFRTVVADKERIKLVQERIIEHPIIRAEVLKRKSATAFVLASWGCECPNRVILTIDDDAEKKVYEKYGNADNTTIIDKSRKKES